jgi:hypothetical protein
MMHKILIPTLMVLLCSCGIKYRKISEFNLQPLALKNGERIKLIFSMTGPGDNRDDKYYNQILAVSQESGDTCNILVPFNHGFKQEDGDSVFNYFNPESDVARILSSDEDKLQSLTNIDSIKSDFPKYQRVIYEPKYDRWLKNDFPTVVGAIGTQN